MPDAPTRVLVVDDDASFRSLLAELLEQKGCQVEPAANAEEALRLVSEGWWHVAVVDLVMPGVSGLDLAGLIRQRSPDTQVLILTGHGDKQTAIAGIHQGIIDYVEKADLDIKQLERSIREAAERSRLGRENRELLARLQESNRLLKGLHDIATALSGEPHLDRVLEHVVIASRELCRAATSRVLLLQPTAGDAFVIVSGAGDGIDTLRGARLSADEGLATLALAQDRPVLAERAAGHPRYSRRSDELPGNLPGFVCAPMRHGAVVGAIMVAGRADAPLGGDDAELLQILARQAAVAVDNALAHERSLNFFTHTSDLLVSLLEIVDVHYAGHSRGTAALADLITRRLGLADADRRNVHFGALLHDIGKIRVDASLLRSSGYTSDEQRKEMQRHPVYGYEMLKPITLWSDLLPIVHSHHERWDGRGYPLGLEGEQIPLGARVVGVAEAFDAMTRDTPHGPRRTPEEALVELEAFAGSQFDPRIVRLFVAEYRLRKDELPK